MAEVSSLSMEQLEEITVGPVGSKFQVEVRHADDSSESIELVRATFPIKGSTLSRKSSAWQRLMMVDDSPRSMPMDGSLCGTYQN